MFGTEFQEALRTAKNKLNNPDASNPAEVIPRRFSPRSYANNNSIFSSSSSSLESSGIIYNNNSTVPSSPSSFPVRSTDDLMLQQSTTNNNHNSPFPPRNFQQNHHHLANTSHVGDLLTDHSTSSNTTNDNSQRTVFSEYRQKYREVKRTYHEETGVKEALSPLTYVPPSSSSSSSRPPSNTVGSNSSNNTNGSTFTTNNSSGGSYFSPRSSHCRQPDHGNIIVNPPEEERNHRQRGSPQVASRYSPQREAWIGMSPLGSSMDIMSQEQKLAMNNILHNHGRGELYLNPYITQSPGNNQNHSYSNNNSAKIDVGQEVAMLKPSRITPNAQRFLNGNGTMEPPYAIQYGNK